MDLHLNLSDWRRHAPDWTAAAFGALLYLVNFHAMTAWMPWFIEMRGWATFVAHLMFGLAAAVLYWRLRRPGPVG